ncbi:MAG: hypothetical protein COS68_02860 [Elusimicrobia bacterium CG06_land_8_20_14_3_00_38_11]|nr:MAG: hypothetical protein COS68_02860 [Elusimicrobia bacterium CG06_land_8_20_14_3_00_38_11]
MRKSILLFTSIFNFTFLIFNCLYCENKVITDVKKWEYIETEHFKIYHYPECKELLPIISEILEDAFNNTTRFYEYRPSKKIPFFIYRNHNEFEQTNIVDVGEGTGGVTEVFKNRFIVYNDGSIRWLRNVIPHEFTHVIQFTVLYEESPLLKALRLSRGIFIPLWMMEGMAEYNTGDIDATTREMVIRDMVSNKNVISLKNLSTFNHLKPHQITPAYKLSETSYHFLVDEYGPDKPQKILKVLRDKLDTSAAFTDTLNISPGLFMKKWEEWLYEKYDDKIIGFKEAKDYGLKLTEDNGDNIPDFNTNPAVSCDGKSMAYITDDDGVNKIVVMSLETKKKKIIAEGNSSQIDVIHNGKISFSPDGNILAFAGEKTQKDYIFIYDIKNEKPSKLPLDIFTVKSPFFSPDGKKIIFIGMERAYNDIYEFNFEDNSVKKITDDMENQSVPSYSPDGNFIAFSQEDSATYQSDVFLFELKTQKKIRLTNFPGNETEPVFSADGERIFFVSDEKVGSPVNIYSVAVDGSGIRKCTDLLTGVSNPCPTPNGQSIVFEYYRNFRKDIYLADISSFENKLQENKQEEFSVESSTENKYLASPIFPYRFKPSLDVLVPFVMYHSEFGLFLATYWQASDLFGNHQISSQLLYSSGSGDLQYSVGYSYLKWRPQFIFSSAGDNSEFVVNSEDIYRDKENTQSIGVVYPLDRFNSISMAVSTKKFTETDKTLDELLADYRTNRYSVAYERDTITGKYLYARFGSDFQLLFRKAFLEYEGDIEYKEYVLRYEKYFPVFSESTVVLGNLFVASEGSNKRYFRLPLRGFSHADDFHIYNRLIAATLEYRFPILTLENIWPISDFFLKSINTFFFTDNGFGFNNTEEYQSVTIDEIKNSVGSGVRFYTFLAGYLLPITVEYAKRTNDSGDRWSFSLGVSLAY